MNTVADTAGGSRGRPSERALPYGLLAFVAAMASILTCYFRIVAETFFGIETLGFNVHLQGVIMWLFGLLAVYALARDRPRHGRVHPLATGVAGLLILVGVLYVHHEQRFEVLAYVLLLVAALLNQRATIAALYDDVRRQSAEIAGFNRTLESEVERQVGEIDRLTRLKSFLAPSVAEIVMAEGSERRLQSHRQYIACLVCDIRGFTAFSEGAEPEETMALLHDYHERIGKLVARHGGTIASRAGDGAMVVFNDPLPCERPVLQAVRLALAIRGEWPLLSRHWQRLGHPIGLGVAIASGYATLGLLGDETRTDYTAVGGVVNLAARLCAQAEDGEILMDLRAHVDVEEEVEAAPTTPRTLKGFAAPVDCFAVLGLRDEAAAVDPPGEAAEACARLANIP